MVRSVLRPGEKYDYMVILQGPQGCGKSTFCQALAGGPEYFEESLTLAASAKEILEQTAGKWVVEIAELSGLTAKDIEHPKSPRHENGRPGAPRLWPFCRERAPAVCVGRNDQ